MTNEQTYATKIQTLAASEGHEGKLPVKHRNVIGSAPKDVPITCPECGAVRYYPRSIKLKSHLCKRCVKLENQNAASDPDHIDHEALAATVADSLQSGFGVYDIEVLHSVPAEMSRRFIGNWRVCGVLNQVLMHGADALGGDRP